MKAHLFDLDTILVVDKMIWIIDKKSPNIPILKIKESDFNLIKKGIFKNRGERLYFGDVSYWVPNEISNEIKLRCKKMKIDITNLSFSLNEFLNSEVIGDLEYDINYDLFNNIKNTPDHIYLIASKNNKKNYERIIKKIENKLYEIGLKIEKIYYISDTFLNRDKDKIVYNKVKILLQHTIGLKTEIDKFIDSELVKYDEIYYYDDELENINIPINDFLKYIIDKTDEITKEKVISEINLNKVIYMNWVSPNKVNRIQTKKITIEYNKLIKTFEGFKFR